VRSSLTDNRSGIKRTSTYVVEIAPKLPLIRLRSPFIRAEQPLCQVRKIGDGRSLHDPNLRDGFRLKVAGHLAAILRDFNCPEAMLHSHYAVIVHGRWLVGPAGTQNDLDQLAPMAPWRSG
jgi:hypothetical protein